MITSYINGIQEKIISSCLNHYLAHDNTYIATEDNGVMLERTLSEIHVLPF